MLSPAFLYSGHTPARPIELRAGPLTLRFEPDTAFLRHIRLGDHEILRALYAAVRHHDWSTIPPRVTLTAQEIQTDSFQLAFDVRCAQGPVDYSWQGTVTGEAGGRIRFTFEGVANTDFLRNRIGLCILHPIEECRGKGVTIRHANGSTEQGVFPREIAPHQPFFDIRGLAYEVMNTGIVARLEMDGDTFEMEDQRNWSDASFKTYCTPLARPLPHRVKKGDRVRQSVTLELAGHVRPIQPVHEGRRPELTMASTPAVALPPLGLCVASHARPWTSRETDRLKALRLSHLRVDLRLADPAYPSQLAQATGEARALGAGLHIALELCEHSAKWLGEFERHLERIQPPVLLWILLHESENPTSERTVESVRPTLQRHAPAAPFAAGTRDFFTEVNRVRPQPGATSSLCYSNNPQVHAFDNTTLVENLAGQVYNVESARQFTSRPVVVSPITLRIRANARAATEHDLDSLPPDVDPRQLSLFGAGWTLGSISKLAATGFVHSLTYYETTGWRGLMETDPGPPCRAAFPSEPGAVFPLYHVLADIAEFGAGEIHPTQSTHPLLAEGLMLFDATGRRRILVANFGDDALELKIQTGTGSAQVRFLDETTAEAAVRRPEEFRRQPGEKREIGNGHLELKLLPFAVARVDIA